jgi:hypothetical protein
VLARFAQRVRQLLVLSDGGGELALGLEEALLEGVHTLGCVCEPGAQVCDLLLQGGQFLAFAGSGIVGRPWIVR